MMTPDCNMSEFYASLCAEHRTQINTHILEVFEKTPLTGNVTLNLAGNKPLRCLQRVDDKDAFVVSTCVKGNRCVTGLDVSYNNLTDEGVAHIAELLQDSSALRSLDLKFNNIQAGGAQILGKSLQCNCTLFFLGLSGNKINDRGATQLASALQVNNTLKELELCACDLGIQSIIAFATMLRNNVSLQSVDFSQPLLVSHQEEWVVHFSDMLAVNSSLLELHLGATGMTDTGMERLSEGLRVNHSLRYLDLRCNHVTRDGAHHLAKVLRQNATLEVIDLSCNRIEDEGAVYLSEVISSPGCSLRELSVSRNSIRTEGLLSLARAMKVNTTLTHIYVWGNHLEEPVCQAFRELISSGRLLPERTDVSVYEVDGRLCLAEVFHRLRKHYHRMDSSATFTPVRTVKGPK